MYNNQILITTEMLNKLKMLMDWQLKQLGISPESVTKAVLLYDKNHNRKE